MPRIAALGVFVSLVAGCATTPLPEAPAVPLSFIELDIAGAQQAIREQRVSCEQITRRYLRRIETYNQVDGLNAIIYINPRALQRARALDKKYAASCAMKRLHCIPVILKDNFDTA
ncbi:MAG: amidase family protein, partial [Gammaproteobacteria bacterium]